MDRFCTLPHLLADAEQHHGDGVWPDEPFKGKALPFLTHPRQTSRLAGEDNGSQHSTTSDVQRRLSDPFAPADFSSKNVRYASEGEPSEPLGYCNGKEGTSNGDVGDLDDRERVSRREWIQLDQTLARGDEPVWISNRSPDIEGELAQWIGEAKWRGSEDERADMIESPCDKAVAVPEASTQDRTCWPQEICAVDTFPTTNMCRRETKLSSEDELFNIALHRNLLNQGDRLDQFLDRCIWRVEDMIVQAKQMLALKPAREEVDVYMDPLSTAKKHGWDRATQSTTTQSILMRDIERLLRAPSIGRVKTRIRVDTDKERHENNAIGTPKSVGRKPVKAAARSHLPVMVNR